MDRISEESGVEWIVKKEEIFEYVQKQYGTLPEYLWSKLYVSAPYFLKEVIEIERIVGIEIIYYCKCIPFYLRKTS